MKPMDIDVCVKYLIDAYHVSPGKDPQALMECLCCLNPALKDDKPTLNAIYGCFLEWWFTRRDCLTNDLAHRVKRIMDYYDMMRTFIDQKINSGNMESTYDETIVIEGKTYNMGLLWDTLRDLVERALLKTLDR